MSQMPALRHEAGPGVGQLTRLVPAQRPPWQTSPSVQALPSSHAVPSGTLAPAQTPAWHVSPSVQALPSSQGPPSFTIDHAAVELEGRHASQAFAGLTSPEA